MTTLRSSQDLARLTTTGDCEDTRTGLEAPECTWRVCGAVVSESRRSIRPTLGGGLRLGGRFLIDKGEPTVEKTDPSWRLKSWGSVPHW